MLFQLCSFTRTPIRTGNNSVFSILEVKLLLSGWFIVKKMICFSSLTGRAGYSGTTGSPRR